MMKKRVVKVSIRTLGVVCAILCGNHSVFAQQRSFSLTGDVLGLQAEKVYLQTRIPVTKEVLLDSSYVREGKFEFTQTLSQPMMVVLRASDNSFGTRFWIENSDITINGVLGQELDIQGSETQDMMNLWNERTANVTSAYNQKQVQIREANDSGDEALEKQLIAESADIRQNQYRKVSEEIVREFPDSYFILNQVYVAGIQEKYGFEDLSKLYNYLSPRLKAEPMGKAIAERLQILHSLVVGETLEPITLSNADGVQVSTSDGKGKYMLITFGAAGFKGYEDGLVDRRGIYDSYKTKGIEFFDFLFNKEVEEVQNVKNAGVANWILVSDFKSWESPIAKKYNITTLPQNFLLDREGKIIAKDIFGDELVKKLNEVL